VVALTADVPPGGEGAVVVWFPPEGDPVRYEGSNRGDEVQIEFVARGSGRYRVELGRGRLRAPLRSRRFRVEALPDDPPDLEVSGPGGEVELKPEDTLSLSILAGDDFALTRLELVVVKEGREVDRAPIADVDGEPRFEGLHVWSPAALGGEGGELTLIVEAWDNDTVHGPKVTRSRPLEVWVPTARDHHRKVLALKTRLLDQSLDLLAALLVDNALLDRDGSREGVLTQYDREARLASGLFTTAAELAQAMEQDRFERREVFLGIGIAIENLARRWEAVAEVVETQIRPDGHLVLDGGTLSRLASRRDDTISELEQIVLDLAAFIDLQIGEEVQDRLAGLEPDLADLADLLRQSQEGAILDEEIEAALEELMRKLAEIAQQMAQRTRGPNDSFQNRMPDQLQRSVMEEIRELLAQGRHDEALEMLRQAMDALEAMRSGLEEQAQQMAGGQEAERLRQALQEGIDEAKRLEAEQQAIIDETEALQLRFGTGDAFSEAEQAKLVRDIEELQERVSALPPDGLGEPTRGQVASWARAASRNAERLAQRFGEGNLQSAAAQAAEVESYMQLARAELNAADGESAEAVRATRQELREARDLAADIGQRLAQADARARRAQGQAADASTGTQQRQGQTAQGVGRLGETMEQMGGSAYNPVSARENLETARRMMERSQRRLEQGLTGPAVGSQQDALRQLQAFRQSLEEAQQSMQQGGPMGQGQQAMRSGQGGRRGPWQRAEDYQGDADSPDDVELSDPDDFVSPEAFRALVQEEAGGDAPERYRPMNNSYYEELIK
jgi:hypothetical protein